MANGVFDHPVDLDAVRVLADRGYVRVVHTEVSTNPIRTTRYVLPTAEGVKLFKQERD